MKSEQRGGLEDHSGPADPVRAQKQCPESEQNALQRAEIGRSAPGPIENQELLLEQEALGHYGPSTTGLNDSGQCGQPMCKEQQQVLHGGTDCARLPSTARHPKQLLRPHQTPIRYAQGRLEQAKDWLEKAFTLGDPKKIKLMASEDPDLEPLWKGIGET